MTRQQIIEQFKKHGLPSDYPLRGTKAQIVAQGVRYFQTLRDFQSIAGRPKHEEQAKLDEVKQTFSAFNL